MTPGLLTRLREGPLGSPAFRAIAAGRFCSATAMTLFRATVLWQLWEGAHDPLAIAGLGAAQFIPSALAGLVAGSVADVRNRRTVALSALAVAFVLALVCVTANALDLARPGAIVAMAMLLSTVVAFEVPARVALLPRSVHIDVLPRALTLHSALTMTAFTTGPVLAGSLLAWGGPTACYSVQATLILLSAVMLSRVDKALGEPNQTATWQWRSIRDGLQYVRSQPILLGCMALDMFAVIFGGATALLPAVARDGLGVGAREYGMLAASLDAGAVCATVAMTMLPGARRVGSVMIASVVLYGLATIGFGLADTFPVALITYGLVGATDAISVVMRGVAIQLSTPDAFRGRVTSVNMIFIGASNQLGAVESGLVAHWTDTRTSLVSGGCGAVLVALLIGAFNRPLRSYVVDRSRPPV